MAKGKGKPMAKKGGKKMPPMMTKKGGKKMTPAERMEERDESV